MKTNLVVITGIFSSLICFNDFAHTAPILSGLYINMRQNMLFLSALKSSEENKDKFINVLFLSYKSVHKIVCMLTVVCQDELKKWPSLRFASFTICESFFGS